MFNWSVYPLISSTEVVSRPELETMLCLNAEPRAGQLIFQSKALIVFWNSFREQLPDDLQGLNLDSNLNSASWPKECRGFRV